VGALTVASVVAFCCFRTEPAPSCIFFCVPRGSSAQANLYWSAPTPGHQLDTTCPPPKPFRPSSLRRRPGSAMVGSSGDARARGGDQVRACVQAMNTGRVRIPLLDVARAEQRGKCMCLYYASVRVDPAEVPGHFVVLEIDLVEHFFDGVLQRHPQVSLSLSCQDSSLMYSSTCVGVFKQHMRPNPQVRHGLASEAAQVAHALDVALSCAHRFAPAAPAAAPAAPPIGGGAGGAAPATGR